jgi:hypothetical protein
MLYCAKYQKPLFKESMLAFEHGGVVEEIRTSFLVLYYIIGVEKTILEKADQNFTKQIFTYFSQKGDDELENFSHDDPA